MATKIYGICSGTSSSKYDLWASVSQSNINTSNNTSKISVKVYLKRNDGNSNSAYNLYENSNTVNLKINGEVRINKNLAIDTRNGVSVLLASYEQTVTHNDDGSLVLTLESSFTMGNSSLTGGSLKGEYRGTTIPRLSDMSFSKTTVNPGDAVGFTITPATAEFTHQVSWSLGDKAQSVSLASGVLSSNITIPKEWTSVVTTSATATISVVLSTIKNGVTIGTRKYELKFLIPAIDEYKPDFTISISRDNGGISDKLDYYIKGISSVNVEPEALSFSYGATLSAITITVGDVSIRRLPAVFKLTSAGDLLVTVAVRDSRGMLTVKTETIHVLDYTNPSVEITSLVRCDENGNANPLGEYGSLAYRIGYSPIDGNNHPVVNLRYRKSTDESYVHIDQVSSSPFIFGDGGLSVGSSYVVCISVEDDICTEAVEIESYISGGSVPFNIRKGGNGASFGKFSEEDMLLDVGWNMRVEGDMDIEGVLKCEKVECQCTELTSSMVSGTVFYPCLNMVFLRIRVDATSELSSNTNHHIATVTHKLPGVFTPLSSVVSFGSGNQSGAGIAYGTGDVVLWSDRVIPAGSRIYISGYYFADYTADIN